MTPKNSHQPPARRADAARNREKILEAGRLAFADPGADVSMVEVARRSGVGSATLYRNFATRRDLLEALYIDEVDAVCDAASTIEGDTPGARFAAWLHRFFLYFTSKRHVATELLEHSDLGSPVFGASRDRVLAAGRPLLRAAQDSQEVQAELTLEQTLDLVVAIGKIRGEPGYVEPILCAALGGLRQPPGG
ncbi:MAG: TetR/AcrR family transcriptional regulator [Actinomycetota bacterium]|nr:TetR/AcrR family transcriptional regulator [Actinomycetota bacterium]